MNTTLELANETVLVTGAGGVLGTALRKILSQDQNIRLLTPPRAELDLRDGAKVQQYFNEHKPTIVFHLAGWVAGIQGNLTFPGDAYYENTLMNLTMVDVCRRYGVRKIVAAGTAAVYADGLDQPINERDIWKNAPHGSEAAYAHAKRSMLAHLEAYRKQYGMEFAYPILTNLYGPNDRFDELYGHVVPSLVARFHRAATENADRIVLWGDGTPTRDFLFAEDAAEALIALATAGSGAYNVATGSSVTIRELAETLAMTSGFSGRLEWDTSKPKGQLVRSYDCERIFSLGWRPATLLADGLKRTIEWYAANAAARRT